MATVSVCMIVKNEEDVLARALDSVREAADEIVVVDTGSSDKTREIASQYTPNVFDFEWVDDFSAARNFSFSKASMDYCMWLDADDVLPPEELLKLLSLKQTINPTVDMVMMRYHAAFDRDGTPTFTYYRERLIRNGAGFLWQGAVHEAISPSGNVIYSDIALTHQKLHASDPDRNLRIFEKQRSVGKALAPREQFYYARELYYHQQYEKSAKQLVSFLDGGQGWIENQIEACRFLAYCRYQTGDDTGALHALLRSLEFDVPRAEVCCEIGKHFFDRQCYSRAVYWYEQAMACQRNDESGAFVCSDCYEFVPCLQLCVCHSRLGNQQLARQYNDRAGNIKPEDPSYLYNRAYFDSL